MDLNNTDSNVTDVTGTIGQTSSLTTVMESSTEQVSSPGTAGTVTETKQTHPTSDRMGTTSFNGEEKTTAITKPNPVTDTKSTTENEGTQTLYTDKNKKTYEPTTSGSTGTIPTQNNISRTSLTVTTAPWTQMDRHSTDGYTGWNQSDLPTPIHDDVGGHADCSDKIGIAAGVGAGAVLVVMVLCLVLLVKMKLKWLRKLRDERLKTDIWTMSTLNNTIINENFTDYTLAPPDDRRSKQASTRERNSRTKLLHSISQTASDRSSSSTYDGQTPLHEAAAIRRSTLSSPDLRGQLKVSAMRQLSAHSNYDMWINQPSEGYRSRTSTFTGGRKDKIDRHVLVNHDEFQAANQTHSQIVTEL